MGQRMVSCSMTFNPEVLVDIVPDPDLVVTMAPEDLGLILLRIAKSCQQSDGLFHESIANGHGRNGFGSGPDAKRYPREKEALVSAALSEAWAWLRSERLVLPAEGTNGQIGHMQFGRRATELLDGKNFSSYRSASEFPKVLLHPTLADKCWLNLARGEFEEAVFTAMKTVEVSVRHVGRYSPDDVGVKLMRKAFHPETGNLTDMGAPAGERVAMMELFAGAIGTFKNPSSHRDVALKLPEAREMIMTASHLLRIVDGRRTLT